MTVDFILSEKWGDKDNTTRYFFIAKIIKNRLNNRTNITYTNSEHLNSIFHIIARVVI